MRLSPEVQPVVLEQRLGFVATVTAEGRPSLSPKATTTLWDEEHLMFADLASPGTIENLATNPHVEINVVDPILRKGYRVGDRILRHAMVTVTDGDPADTPEQSPSDSAGTE